ncbi:MAG: glycine betaine ABC transporter substrate-binding protein [Pseudonocardiaceae bacterium]
MRSTLSLCSRKRTGLSLVTLATTVVLAAGCGGLSSSGPAAEGGSLAEMVNLEGQSYTIGSKEFDEGLVLCQISVAALESVGAQVTDRCKLGGTEVNRNALLAGDLDLYWEYTGTAWVTFLRQEPIQDSQQQYQAVKEQDLAQNQIVWLEPTPFNNTYGFAVAAERARELELETLSDMAAYIRSGQPGNVCIEAEYQNRDDGFQPMQRVYEFQVPPDRVKVQQDGAIYQNTANPQECLFGEVYTTDGRIPRLGLKVLRDDKNFHPLYNAAPTVRQDAYNRNPDIAKVFAPISAALTDEVMVELNRQKSADGKPEREVARDWLTERGFIGGGS